MSEIYSKVIELVGENTTFIQSCGLKPCEKLNIETVSSGKPNIVRFENITEFNVNDKWFSERKEDSYDEAE